MYMPMLSYMYLVPAKLPTLFLLQPFSKPEHTVAPENHNYESPHRNPPHTHTGPSIMTPPIIINIIVMGNTQQACLSENTATLSHWPIRTGVWRRKKKKNILHFFGAAIHKPSFSFASTHTLQVNNREKKSHIKYLYETMIFDFFQFNDFVSCL